MLRTRFVVITGMIVLAAVSRLLPHPPNFTPIAALALFGGAYLADRRLAFLVPLAAMFASDLVLGLHRLMPVVYGCFAVMVCVGGWLRTRRRVLPVAGATLAGSILFFVSTNFGVWAVGTLYPKTVQGLIECYGAAIPFFRNTFLGDAFYAAVLFGGMALAERCFPVLSGAREVVQPRSRS